MSVPVAVSALLRTFAWRGAVEATMLVMASHDVDSAPQREQEAYARDRTAPGALRLIRLTLGRTQQSVADEAGITREWLGALEMGRAQPRLGTALALSRVLATDVDILFPGAVKDPGDG